MIRKLDDYSMVYLIGVWLGLLLSTQVIGTGVLNQLVDGSRLKAGDRLILSCWLGTIALAVSCMAMSLIGPLTPGRGAIVLLGLVGLSLCRGSNRVALGSIRRRLPREQLGLGLSAVVLMAAVMSRSVSWHDAGYYHASAIRWFAQYGSVPGIALLFNNLGFTSSWFALVAPLSGPGVAQTSVVGNGFAAVLLLLHWLIASQRWLRRTGQMSDRLIGLFGSGALGLSLTVRPFSEIMVSPSPDFPVLVLVGTIAWALLLIAKLDAPDQPPSRLALLPLILALGAVTIKLTAIPTLLVSGLFVLWHHWRSPRSLLLAVGLGALILGPNLGSSLVTSGCPLYPSAFLCMDLPWAPTAQSAQAVAAGTHDWVSWYGTPPPGTNPWLWAVTQVVKNGRDRLIFLIMGGAGFVGLGMLWQMRRAFSRRRLPGELWVMALGVTGIGFLLLTSIFARFLMPYILVLLGLIGAWGIEQWSGRSLGKTAPRPNVESCRRRDLGIPLIRHLYRGIALVATATMLVSLSQYQGRNALLPPALPQSPIVQKTTNSIAYFAPKSGDLPLYDGSPYTAEQVDRCWAAPLPCAYAIGPDVQLRDPVRGVAAGFERRSGR
jgi:hypothetical protein